MMRRLSARSVKRTIQIAQCWRSRGNSGLVLTIRQVHRKDGTAEVVIWRDATGGAVPRKARLTFMELGRDFRMVIRSNGERVDAAV